MATALDEGIHLTWDVSVEEDFQYFILEKSLNSEFQEYETFETIDTSYIDLEYMLNETNYYRLAAVDYAGNVSEYSDMVEATLLSLVGDLTPEVFALHQNYPNPFNPQTNIQIDIAEKSHVSLAIFNIMGQKVATLVNGNMDVGIYHIKWTGLSDQGNALPSGMYFYEMKSPAYHSVKKLVLVK